MIYISRFFSLLLTTLFFVACGNNSSSSDMGDDTFSVTERVYINEILTANSSTNYDPDFKEFSDWIELYNDENHTVDISGFYLSDDITKPMKWEIPNGTKINAQDYILIWADGNNKNAKALHTNFKLSQDGEAVVFSDKNGIVQDTILFDKQKSDITCAKAGINIVYMNPTPAKKNTKIYETIERTKKPKFSKESGFYQGSQTIELTQENDSVIFYTTDGSIPTKKSKIYNEAIKIDKTTVIRIRALAEGKFFSNIINHTFLINEDVALPVVSLTLNDSYLYSQNTGIYTNYTEDWIREGSVEYIKDGESRFSTNIGVRIFGNSSRQYAQKSFSIFTKDKYGPKSIKYSLFEDKKHIEEIKSFILRSSRTRWGILMIRDTLAQSVVQDNMDLDYQAYIPVLLFLNGKYWGIYYLKEKINKDYLQSNHKIKNDVDILKNGNEVTEGNNQDYITLMHYLRTNDLSEDEHYNYIASQIDVKMYINYMITEIYSHNRDWPYNNVKYWKEKKENTKWRWIIHDLDSTYLYHNHNTISFLLKESELQKQNPLWSTELFRLLMKNNDFKNEFISRFTTHLHTTFRPQRVHSIITKLKEVIRPEVQRHFDRWPGWVDGKFWEEGATWSTSTIYTFADERANNLRTYMQTTLGASGNNELYISLANQGKLYIDDIALTEDFYGEYFDNATVTLKAVANEGYKFIKWSNGQTDQEIELTINDDTTISAKFIWDD